MPWLLKVVTIMAVITLILDIFLGWRLGAGARANKHSTLPPYVYTGWMLLSLFFLAYPIWCHIQYYVIGGVYHIYEDPPAWMMYLFWFGLGFSAHLFGWILCVDLIKLILKGIKWPAASGIRQFQQLAYLFLFIGVFGYTAYTMYSNSAHIQMEKIEVQVNQLPSSLEGLRIAHISDVQADRFTGTEKLNRFVGMINNQEPDIVLFTGDLVSWGTNYIETGAKAMGRIEAKYGVYAVLGDHDFWAGTDTVRNALEANGITFFDNKNKNVQINGADVGLTGITQIYDQRIGNTLLKTLLSKGSKTDLSILFSHQINRKIADITRSHGYNLALGGHTHGGQFAPAFLIFPISAPMLETEFVSGIYCAEDLFININNGLGYTLAPVRLHAPAEISMLHISTARSVTP